MESRIREKTIILFMVAAIFLSLFSASDNWFKNKINQIDLLQQQKNLQILHRIAVRGEKNLFLTRQILPMLRRIIENQGEI
ncbi:MAG: hypothetical protein ACOYXC_06305, partial [Candidatus Rifleibacteriota bacterium]